MQKYQIIPRRFRPKRFSEVVGHEAVLTTLKNSITQNRLGQAYLFSGARGCGKTTLARLFAKSLNCSARTADAEPCNQCQSCREIQEGASLDILEIDGASHRGIDDIREINETAAYAPSKGRYKIIIIDEVHMLTKEAFNALLKTLEEPSENAKFFFATTEPHKIPPTIISRCQRFHLSRLPETTIAEKLRRIATELQIAIEDGALLQVSQLSEGSLRDAESLLDQLISFGQTPITLDLTRSVFGLLSLAHLTELDLAIQTQNFEKGLEIAHMLYASGTSLSALFDSLYTHFHAYLLAHLAQKNGLPHTKDQCLYILDLLIQWEQQMAKNPFKEIHLQMLFLHLVRSKNRTTLDQLVKRLTQLESPSPTPIVAAAPPAPLPTLIMKEKAPLPSPPKVEPKAESKVEPEKPKGHPSKYDTLLRFAAVELEGTVQN